MCPIFVIKFSGVSDLQGVKVPVFPLTLLVIVTTVLRYRAACDTCDVSKTGLALDWWCEIKQECQLSQTDRDVIGYWNRRVCRLTINYV